MAKIRRVDYYTMQVRDRAGEGASMLKALKKHGVGLRAFSAFPEGKGTQVDFIPEDSREFLAAAKALEWDVSTRKVGFLVHGKDRTGALAGLMGKLGKAGINVIAIDAVGSGRRRFGAIFWVKPADVARAAKILGAR
jgi:hypothetical protein